MGASSDETPSHFVLVKREGISRAGAVLNARKAAEAVLNSRVWPLWKGTRNRRVMKAGDHVAVYLAGPGNQIVIAKAVVSKVTSWSAVRQSPKWGTAFMGGCRMVNAADFKLLTTGHRGEQTHG